MPSSANLEYGEIAVNYHDGVEKLFIKNDNDKVKTIRTDNQLAPIEKHEDQEFVYRKAVNENEAQSLRFDRIYGKTLAWNQLIQYTASAWRNANSDASFGSNYITITVPSGGYYKELIEVATTTLITDHKYYTYAYVKSLPGGTFNVNIADNNPLLNFTSAGRQSSIVQSNTTTGVKLLYLADASNTVEVRDLVVIDLTLMFGAGNEPSTVAEFESMFPGYHDYSAGKLISNDAESIETVGFNLWDEEWENGSMNTYAAGLDGSKIVNGSGYLRSKNLISILPNTPYYVAGPDSFNIGFYDKNQNYLGYQNGQVGTHSITSPAYAYYMSIQSNSPFNWPYAHNICINVSDPDFNGQYEPYKKSALGLNLNSIKVYSPNIWDEETKFDNGTNCLKTKNYIPVEAGCTYYVKVPYTISSSGVYLKQYNSNMENVEANATIYSNTFTVGANTSYIELFFLGYGGSTYSNDITINKSDPAFNGRYFPHGIITIEGGLKSVNNGTRDEIVGTKLYRRVGTFANLGSLNWAKGAAMDVDNSYYNYWVHNALPSDAKNNASVLCGQYITTDWKGSWESSNIPLWSICVQSNTYLIFIAPGTNTGDSIKTLLANVPLYYELNNVEVYDLVNPIHSIIKSGTIESRISPNPDGLSAPMVADISYTQTSEYILGELDSKLGDIESILETI